MVEVDQIGVVLCDKDSESHEVLIDIDQSEMDEDDFQDATEATRTMLDSLSEKDFTANKRSARVHEFDGSVNENGDHPVKSILESLRSGSNFNSDIRALADIYLKTDFSHSGIIIITRFSIEDHDQLGIVKAPFSVGYEPHDEVGLSQLDEIIEDELKKGSVYPRVKYSTGEERLDEIGIYQRSWAKHWWKFHGVKKTRTNDEILHERAVSEVDEGEPSPLEDVESTDELEDLRFTMDDEELSGTLRISIAGVAIDVTVRDLVERNVFLVEDDDYYVVLAGNEPTYSIKNPQGSEYRTEILENLTEYDSFDDIV